MKNLKSTHINMENLYKVANQINKCLDASKLEYTFGNYNDHYLTINKKLVKQNYFIPVFTIKNLGDIGVNLDGIFYEIIIPKRKINLNYLKRIIKKFPDLEIYGFKNCLLDFYNKDRDVFDILNLIKKSSEQKIQIGKLFKINIDPDIIIKEMKAINTF